MISLFFRPGIRAPTIDVVLKTRADSFNPGLKLNVEQEQFTHDENQKINY